MTPDNPPTEPPPPVKEPPNDDPRGGQRPNDDIKEPQPDPKKIAENRRSNDDLPSDLKNLNSV